MKLAAWLERELDDALRFTDVARVFCLSLFDGG